MANISISLDGIDQAIENLGYRQNSVKYKAIHAIRSHYHSEEAISHLNVIETDALVGEIWDIQDDPAKIRSKRRNYFSIKSSIIADLDKLSQKGMNIENITLTDNNIFDMTEEAKSNLLSSFTDAVRTGDINLDQATNLLKAVTDFLDQYQEKYESEESSDIVNQIKKILSKITEDVLSEEDLEEAQGLRRLKRGDIDFEEIEEEDLEDDEDVEEIELDEDEELEEIELDDDEDIEEIEEDEDIEEIELDEDEELEEIDELEDDEDVEEIELDEDEELEEIELDDDEDIEEIDEDEDIEEIELDEDEELEEIDELEEDEDVEEIELDEDEELEEIELDDDEEIEEIDEDEDIEEIELDEDEELEEIDELEDDEDVEEIELDEDEELEEIELDDDEEIEEIDEDEDIEEIELDEDEELEEIDELEEDEDVEEIELDEDEELDEIELEEDEELEELDLDEDEELTEVDGLTEDELKALEEYREKKELAEHFDKTLGEREKKYNKYTTVPEGLYTIGTKKSLKASLELQQFEMPKVYMGIYPVTNALFEIFVDETGYVTTAEKKGYGTVYYSRFRRNSDGAKWDKRSGSKEVEGATWFNPFGPGSNLHQKRNHPVVQVSVDDAFVFASWIGRRLPTEAEWESAARTDLGYRYPWGNEFNPAALNIEQSGIGDTSAVDAFDDYRNEFNIVDMLGNIMEWTSDTQMPPVKTKKPQAYSIAKGAAWNSRNDVTIGSRALFKPDFTSNTIGFRCTSEIFK